MSKIKILWARMIQKLQVIQFHTSTDLHSRKFKKYLKEVKTKSNFKGRVIMVEFEQIPENIIALSKFLPVIREKYQAKTTSYLMRKNGGYPKFMARIRYKLSTSRRLVGPDLTILNYSFALATHRYPRIIELTKSVKTLEELIKLSVDEIKVGDLIYDKYLSYHRKPTVDLDSAEFIDTMAECLFYFFTWREILEENDVAAICISHSVYHFGIPARIGVTKNIEVFQVSLESIYRLSPQRNMAFKEELDFPLEFKKLSEEEQISARTRAKESFHERFDGRFTPDMPYVLKSSFGSTKVELQLEHKQNQPKILVAAHDFYDSPHVFGDFFYPDFLEWMNRLGELSEETEYLWLIKTHPYLRGSGREILAQLCEKFPKFQLLPMETTHNQLIEFGIDFVLTVYGTIASEYACFKIPTINSSQNNPHASYEFCITPDSKDTYEKIILNLKEEKFSLNFDQVYDFYFMKHLKYRKSWIFNDYKLYLAETNFNWEYMDRKVYSYFVAGQNRLSENQYIPELIKFVHGKEYKFCLELNLGDDISSNVNF
jgi:hypothetical protein